MNFNCTVAKNSLLGPASHFNKQFTAYYLALGNQMNKCIFLVLISLSANTADIQPFPRAKISIEQWQGYFDSVSKEFGETKKTYEEQSLVVFSDNAQHANIAFTTKNHPAHPAWITRYVTEDNESVSIAQIGYFAGEEPPFAKLFQDYAKLNDKVKEHMGLENGWDK